MFTVQDLQTIAQLIGRAEIKGSEATTVAILLQKIGQAINQSKAPAARPDSDVAPAQGTTTGKQPAPNPRLKK